MNFTAAVRMKDGSKQLLRVSDAKDHHDCRAFVWEECPGVATILVAERSKPGMEPIEEREAA